MTDRALVEKLPEMRRQFEERMMTSAIWEYCPEEFGELLDFIEQSLTPPEGDTLSGEVVEKLREGDLEWLKREVEWCRRHEHVAEAQRYERIVAALQSRVSPQAGMREAMKTARDAAAKIVRAGAPGCGNGNKVIANEIIGGLHDDYMIVQIILNALATAPIPMSGDAK